MNEINITNLSQFFIHKADHYPQHQAIFIDGNSISYELLSIKIKKLAYFLTRQTGQHCALLSSRGLESYTALVATLMAGKVCIPLTTKNPAERNFHMIDFAETDILIVDDKSTLKALELLQLCKKPLLVLLLGEYIPSSQFAELNHRVLWSIHLVDQPLLEKALNAKNAYLLFTSGTTGQPKAVMTTHVSIIEYINYMYKFYKPNDNDRFTQITDLTFDAAIHELFLCWAGGACLYILTDHYFTNIAKYVMDHQLTFWISVPSLVSFLKQRGHLKPKQFSSIRYTLFLGEPLSENIASYWHEIAPNSIIDNLYGPTEATITFTMYRWKNECKHDSGYVPIGYPIYGKCIVLNEKLNPIQDNLVGELYIGGSQLASGYWNNPTLSQERFLEISHLKEHGGTYWYKTGDLVYWEDKSGYVFKSRDVDIFKIRGGRAEKLEIEIVLRGAAQTEMVAVLPWPIADDGAALGLIAFVAMSSQNESDILKMCRSKLPDYMVPTKILFLDIIPVNKNGKTDYQLLKMKIPEYIPEVFHF